MMFESGVLRSIGISRLGLLTITAAEHLGVVAAGAASGAATGYAMTRLAMVTVAFAERGRDPGVSVPVVTDWMPVMLMYGVFFVTALLAVAIMTLAFERSPLSSISARETHAVG